MGKEPRKASEVLLDLESKMEVLLGLVRTQDLTIKVLSNKLNVLMEKLEKSPSQPQIMVEAVNTVPNTFSNTVNTNPEKNVPVEADFNLPVEDSPNGFRRTSRPETYSGDNAYLPPQPKAVEQRFPTQIPRPSGQAEIIVPSKINRQSGESLPTKVQKNEPSIPVNTGNVIPVSQRVVDANSKSVFLADVEIIDLSTMQLLSKTRTNGAGKWNAPLSIGAYRINIRKRESVSKEKLEVSQDIQVDGAMSPLELPLMIIRK